MSEERERVMRTKLSDVLDAWPLYHPNDEDDFGAGSVLFVEPDDKFVASQHYTIDRTRMEQKDDIQKHLAQIESSTLEFGFVISAADKARLGLDAKASRQSSIDILLADRTIKKIPNNIYHSLDPHFFNSCINTTELEKHRNRPEAGDGSAVFAVVTKAHVATVTAQLASSQAMSGRVGVGVEHVGVDNQAGLHRGMEALVLGRGVVGIEMMCYKVVYSGGEPEKICRGVRIATTLDQSCTTLEKKKRRRDKKNPDKKNPVGTITDVMHEREQFLNKEKLKAEIDKSSAQGQMEEEARLAKQKLEAEIDNLSALKQKLEAEIDNLSAQMQMKEQAQVQIGAEIRRLPDVGLVFAVVFGLIWICSKLFESWKTIQDAATGANLSAALATIGFFTWLISSQRQATGRGFMVLGLVVIPCIATSLDAEEASLSPWEQAALVAVVVAALLIILMNKRKEKAAIYNLAAQAFADSGEALLLKHRLTSFLEKGAEIFVGLLLPFWVLRIIYPVKWRQDGGGHVQKSMLNADVEQNRSNNDSGEALLLNAPSDLYNDVLDHRLSWVCFAEDIKPKQDFKTDEAELIATKKKERESVLKAVKMKGLFLYYASEALKDDREIVLQAVKSTGYALKYASQALQNDRDIVIEAVKNNSLALHYSWEEKKNSIALQYASKDLKNDRGIVLEAVKNNGGALQYASEDLKNDTDIVSKALENNGDALEYASDDLKDDRKIVLITVRKSGTALRYASKALQNEREIVSEAVENNGNALEYASDDLKDDIEIVLRAVRKSGTALRYASKALQKEIEDRDDRCSYASGDLMGDRIISPRQ